MKQNTPIHRMLLVLLSVALLSAGWLGITGLTLLVAFIPLLVISENLSDSKRDFWRMFGWATLTFMLWSAVTIFWVWNATPLGPLAAGIVGTFYNLCGFMLYHYTSKRAPRALAYTMLVAVWIATEWAYNSADVMTFPWLLLGHGFSGDIWAVQWYEYTGIFGGTLWVMVSNIAIFEVLRTRTRTAKVRAAAIVVLPMLLSAVLLLIYKPSERTTQISVIQPNVPCYEAERQAQMAAAAKAEEKPEKPEGCALIGIEDFMNVELRTAKILTCEKVPKAKKLLKLTVDLGYEQRQVVSGIAKWYEPDALVGKKIVLVANLKPATLCGIESNGMILASGEETVRVVFLADDTPLGERVR